MFCPRLLAAALLIGTPVAAVLTGTPAAGQPAPIPPSAPPTAPPTGTAANTATAATDPLPTPDLAADSFPALVRGNDRTPDLAQDLAWPEIETATEAAAGTADTDVRYTVTVTGWQALKLDGQFRQLSALWQGRSSDANRAQIEPRIAEARDLIDQLLRSVGHYGGTITTAITEPAIEGQPLAIALTIEPGPRYTFSAVTVTRPDDAIGGDPAPLVLPLLGVKPGDPVDANRVLTAESLLQIGLAERGYAFATIGAREIIVDHATRTAVLNARVDIGRRGRFGNVYITGETQGYTDGQLAELPRFRPGDAYSDAGRDDFRRALIFTGLFGSVDVKPVGGEINADDSQNIDLVATTERAPVRTIAASLGYQTVQGFRAEASWSNRNLLKPEGAFTVRGVGAEREQALRFEVERRNFKRRDQSLSFGLGFSAEQQNAYSATTATVLAALRRESNIIWQKPLTYSVGLEATVTRQRDRSAPDDPRFTYYILAAPSAVTWDRSDDLLNPRRGFRLTARLSPEFTLRSGSEFAYLKAQIEGTAYQPLTNALVAAARLHFGSIAGAARGRVAPNRRFYAGGGGSVRGYSFQQVGPLDATGAPTGGNSLAEAAFELRYRFHAFGNDLGLVGFVDAGNVYPSTLPSFDALRVGAGLGVRLYTGFGPVRIDVATPVNARPGDPRLQFYVSIGQAF